MARFNEILVGRFNRFAQKYFSMKGGPVTAQLASEISLMHALFNGVENRGLEGWTRYWANFPVIAVAAVQSSMRFRNPPTSNVIAVFERIDYSNTVASTFLLEMQPTNADLNVIGFTNNARLDPRGGQPGAALSQQPVLIPSQSSAAFPGQLQARWTLDGAGATNPVTQFINNPDQEITLFPGDAIQIADGTANQTVQINIMWRERVLEDSERFI